MLFGQGLSDVGIVGFVASRFAPREALLQSIGLCREALHHASMISHRGRDY